MKILRQSQLRDLWGKAKPIERKGIKYFCNRMSYGDYFFEPIPNNGERDGFAKGTIWVGKRFIHNK